MGLIHYKVTVVYTSKLLGVEDKSWIIVEPVVVKPEKLSNNASLKKKTLLNKK